MDDRVSLATLSLAAIAVGVWVIALFGTNIV